MTTRGTGTIDDAYHALLKRWSVARVVGVVACVGSGIASFLPARTVNLPPDVHTKLLFQDDSGVSGVLAVVTLICFAVNRRRARAP